MQGPQEDRRRQRRTRPPRHTGWWGASSLVLAVALGISAYASQAPAKKKATAASPPHSSIAGLSAAEINTFTARFENELWPLMQAQCLPCHGEQNKSQFLMLKAPKAAFLKMLGEGHFDEDNHSSVVERVSTTDKTIVMPPPEMGTLKPAEIAVFHRFAEAVRSQQAAHGVKADEQFPAHLLTEYDGKRPSSGAPDNTFLSFRQLRGKVKAIFGDEWVRSDRNLFLENVHLFGGADFNKRFDETTKASPTFLTGVDLMSRDIASKAYLERTGPFAGFPEALPSPAGLKAPSPEIKASIARLYNRMLFRNPTPTETQQAFAFLQSIYKSQERIAETAAQDLRFQLTVKDGAGLSTSQQVLVRVTADTGHALYSELLDQSKDVADEKNKTATKTLGQPFAFAPGDRGQKVFLTNAGTHGNVSIASVALRGPLPAKTETVITVDDPSVRLEGAWRSKKDDNFPSYEDNNENKGDSHITFPVSVEKPGRYEVAVTWRRYNAPQAGPGRGRGPRGAPAMGAENVRVEVVSRDKASRVAIPPAPKVPPKGEAHFFVDQTVDTIPFWDLKTAFRFGPNDGIEIRNAGTRKRVVADAVRLTLASAPTGENPLILRAEKALERQKWAEFPLQRFRPYNTIGPLLLMDTDDEKGKREDLRLFFPPVGATSDGFDAARFYRVGIVFPGQVDNETRVPVVVKAQASAPIVQVVYPAHAFVGAPVTLDASSTFNIQHSPLTFEWTQIGGPRVKIEEKTAKKLAFTAPKITAQQAAWEGLCRALITHPDFLFSRPRSLASITDSKQRRRLQLVKIAQDLLARTPTAAEVAKVDGGAPLSAMVDTYLKSKEFQDFYFHRVRLYLESHGTPTQDEPARLWTYIALKERPFKEILTADYTVDTNMKKQARPSYHGKTGVLTMKGFIEGKPGLPHFNYPAQVTEKFLGYIFEVPDEIVQARVGITASATTDPNSVCYTCHKVLTPLAYQRGLWDDAGNFRRHDETGIAIDASDQKLVASYPYKGNGMEAFAVQAANKERFVRTILQTHFVWYFGREMRYETDERILYKRLWDAAGKSNYAIRPLIKAMVLSPEYLNGPSQTPAPKPTNRRKRLARLAEFHRKAMGSPPSPPAPLPIVPASPVGEGSLSEEASGASRTGNTGQAKGLQYAPFSHTRSVTDWEKGAGGMRAGLSPTAAYGDAQ